MTAHTHSTCALAAAQGDDAALARLVQAYQQRVYRFGLRVCKRPEDAEDAVQEAFLKLWRRPDVMAHPSALWWLFSVVRFLCLASLKPFLLLLPQRTLGQEAADEADLADATPSSDAIDPELALQRWELVQAVHAAIAQLERPYREVLILRDLEGLSGEETCRALGIELASMKTRLHRARGQLRAALEHYMPADDTAERR